MGLIWSGQDKEIIGKSIFLAGCSPRRDQVLNWRINAINYFNEFNFEGTLIIPEPEFGKWDDYLNVVEWELEFMDKSNIVLFWIPRSMKKEIYGLTSNVEFGMCVGSGKKIVFGRPEGSDHNRYLDHLYQKTTGNKPFSDLKEMINSLIKSEEGI